VHAQDFVNWIFLAGFYASVAVGFSLVWGIMNIVNLAHGALVLVGAYIALVLYQQLHLDPFLSIPIAMALLFVIGAVVQYVAINRVIRAPFLVTFMLTFGLDLLIVDLIQQHFGGDVQSISTSYAGAGIDVASTHIAYDRVGATCIAVALTAGLSFFLSRTRIGNAILAGQELEAVLKAVAHDARELAGAATSTIVVPSLDGDGESALKVAIADGAHADELAGLQVPMEGSVSGDVMRTQQATVVADASSDPRTYQPMVSLGHMGPMVLVPLMVQGRAIGTLAVANPVGGPVFEEQEVRLVETFANQASVALEYARAQRELQRLAVLDDRERIARELHDGVIQSLFAVGMGLQAVAQRSGDREIESRVESAVTEIDRAIRDLRNYIFGLRPGLLADRQLRHALDELITDFAEKSGVTTVPDIDEGLAAELAPRSADLVQLTREALSNVGRHARAATCRVSLFREYGQGVLQIEDDGQGFDTAAAQPGQGLRNLRERVTAMGGQLTTESVTGEGTTIRIALPL